MNLRNDEIALTINELIEWLKRNYEKHRGGNEKEREMSRKEIRWIETLQEVVAELPEDEGESNVSFLP